MFTKRFDYNVKFLRFTVLVLCPSWTLLYIYTMTCEYPFVTVVQWCASSPLLLEIKCVKFCQTVSTYVRVKRRSWQLISWSNSCLTGKQAQGAMTCYLLLPASHVHLLPCDSCRCAVVLSLDAKCVVEVINFICPLLWLPACRHHGIHVLTCRRETARRSTLFRNVDPPTSCRLTNAHVK